MWMILTIIISLLILGFIIFRYISVNYYSVPELSLIGDKTVSIVVNTEYKDLGAKATIKGIDITDRIKIDNKVDNKKIGQYEVKYTVTNPKGLQKRTITRKVLVKDTIPPVISLTSGNLYQVSYAKEFIEPGYKAIDNLDGDITSKVKVEGSVNTKKLGTYTLTYTVKDSSLNETKVTRDVVVVDNISPSLTLNGSNVINISTGGSYSEAGYKAIDNLDGDITNKVSVSNGVNSSVAGVYYVTYYVTDSSGNEAYVVRTVYVGTEEERTAGNRIEISIDQQYLWYYKNGSLVISSPIVTGTRGVNDTPRGNFTILNKAQNIYLIGPDYKSYVNYWMAIVGGAIGLHDASWRNGYFGGDIYLTNGSHGCINLPYNVAQIIYQNASIGTPVKVY